MKRLTATILIALGLASSMVWAHSGGTDRNGCHHDRKTGGYHCY